MLFDSHQHFWQLANPFTDWPTADLQQIYRDFGPTDLRPLVENGKSAGTILVQAAADIAETRYCLDIAQACDFVKGVVGWLDFHAIDALTQLENLASNPLFKGLRPMVQSIDEPGWLIRRQFGPIYEFLIENDLSLDGLVWAHQISDLTALAQRYSQLRIVLDHAGKPPISSGESARWTDDIAQLAAMPNVYCKLSGLWTEADGDCSIETIQPWVDQILAVFGTNRVMWGSDWPVIQLAGSYSAWLNQCEEMLSNLSVAERDRIFVGNGKEFYRVD